MTRPVIALTTDFGEIDAYVAIMKGVILGICPRARLVDISHRVRPQAVAQAAYLLSTAAPYFPPGTIHLVVVDPGVGTARHAVAVASAQAVYVAPDNGVLTLALARDPAVQAVHLTNPRYHLPEVSATFHGRDIFAPAAAHIACGVPLADLGQGIDPHALRHIETAQVRLQGAGPWRAQVIHVDHFGNVVTNVHVDDMAPPDKEIVVHAGGKQIVGIQRTFGDAATDEALAYRGSSGRLEVAVCGGSAARVLGIDIGDPILVLRGEKAAGVE